MRLDPGDDRDLLLSWCEAKEVIITPFIKNETGKPYEAAGQCNYRPDDIPVLKRKIEYSIDASHLEKVSEADKPKVRAFSHQFLISKPNGSSR